MLLTKIFVSWLSLCSRKTLYKASIHSCYNDYMSLYNIKTKDPQFNEYIKSYDIEDWKKLSDETKECILENSRKQTMIVEEMVALVKIYCNLFPDEKICHHWNYKTYDEFPYRLPQTLPEFIKLL